MALLALLSFLGIVPAAVSRPPVNAPNGMQAHPNKPAFGLGVFVEASRNDEGSRRFLFVFPHREYYFPTHVLLQKHCEVRKTNIPMGLAGGILRSVPLPREALLAYFVKRNDGDQA